MKIEFNHGVEKLDEVMENCVISEKTGSEEEYSDATIRQILLDFSYNIQSFYLGVFIEYLNLKNEDVELAKISQLVNVILDDLGWEKFVQLSSSIAASVEEARAEEASEKGNGEPELPGGVTDLD